MRDLSRRTLSVYLAVWRFYRRYFRYSVQGFENLPCDRSAMIVGYHGRPVAYDLCILLVEIYERCGYFPHAVVHAAVKQSKHLGKVADALHFVTGDGPDIREALARKEHIVVVPGGTREGCRSFRHRHEVQWGPNTGYIKLALKYNLPIVPVGAHGVDNAYFGLNDGYVWGKKVKMPARLPFWLGIGPLGLWPLSPPFPARIQQRIGRPIELPIGLDSKDDSAMNVQHERIQSQVQSLLAADGTRS